MAFWVKPLCIAAFAAIAIAPAAAQDRRDPSRQDQRDQKAERDQKDRKDEKEQETPVVEPEQSARPKDIATQPVRDVGIMKTKVPPLLQEALKDPYSLDGMRGCPQLAAGLRELNDVLGPDFEADPEHKRRHKIKVTGGTVASLIVPFRGIVREVSGAASAQRELDDAIDAGLARRGFLRGVYTARRCRAPI